MMAVSLVFLQVMTAMFSFPMHVSAGEMLGENDFDSGKGLPWHICESATAKMGFEIEDGVYRITIVNPGGASNGYDLDATWDPINISANNWMVVDLTFTASRSIDVAEWAFHLGGDGRYTNGVCFPAGTVIEFDNMSLVDETSNEHDYHEQPAFERCSILVNQIEAYSANDVRSTGMRPLHG